VTGDARPACLVTGEVPPYRRGPFRLLAMAEGVEVLPFRELGQAGAARRAGSGRYRAVIAGLGGRIALPGAYLAARRAGIPFVLWTSIWAHPRTLAHALSWLPTRAMYRRADAVVTYGPHVTRYVQRHRRAGNVVEAPQAVDSAEMGVSVPSEARAAARARAGLDEDGFLALFAGRVVREKGVEVLLDAWRLADLGPDAALAVAGEGPLLGRAEEAGARALGQLPRSDLPALYAAADALVLPSIRTATFLEPWGLVINEAMHQGTPAITSDAVGAAAGGLVVDGRNGLVAPAGDADALAARLRTLARNPELRERLGSAARADVARYTPAAWAEGMVAALRAVGASRSFVPLVAERGEAPC
jgi:glycosyltransferase involved in cell wall biosynthesis